MKGKFHTQPPTKKAPLKVEVEVIKKGPLAESLTSSLFSSAAVIKKKETKGNLLDFFWFV